MDQSLRTAERIIARWAGKISPLLDGILEDVDGVESLDQLVIISQKWLEENGHIHRYLKQDPRHHGLWRVCRCGKWISPDDYAKLKGN